jgi:two-component system cell cycle response regulator PopA
MRVVVRGPDVRGAREAQALLAAAGCDASVMLDALRSAPDGEDVSVVLPGHADAAPPNPPLLARLAGLSSAAPPPLGLSSPRGFTSALALDAPARLLAMQFEACLRLAVAEEERARRAATAAALGIACPPHPEPRKLRALYIGAPSAMFLALERALSQHGGLVAAAFTSYAGFDHLHDEPFDVVVLNGAQDATTAISLCAALRRNAALYHLPTMVMTAPGDAATATGAIERGASAVAESNAPCGPSLGWLFEAVRRERRRRAAEHDMRALRDLMGDPRTGLLRREPFDAHLARLAADHHASGRPMSLAALRVLPAHGARQPGEEVWRRGFTEIASLAGRLMRDADTGTVFGADLIVVALPASDVRAAKRTAERIASVAECTAFAAGDNSAGPLVFEQSAVELQPGESGAGMLARALRAIEVEDIPA